MPQSPLLDFPVPDDAALAHSRRLQALLCEQIDAGGGSLSFRRYMELVLYAPGLGYYSAGQQRFGAGGDFTTAPEISPVFAQCLARQVAQVLAGLGDGAQVLEFGAGSGALAAQLLLALDALNVLPERYLILELSADLRQRQRETLAAQAGALSSRVHWLDTLPEPGFNGVMLGNEVLDAMPVERFAVREQGLMQSLVCYEGDRFQWGEAQADSGMQQALADIEEALAAPLAQDYVSEFNPGLHAWFAALSQRMQQGVILLIDYGYTAREYYDPQRRDGTLICHYRHRAHEDVFLYPGLQDLTANVDFTAVARSAQAAGLDVLGYTTQAHFLIACGLDEVFAQTRCADQVQQLLLSQQVKTLTLPSQMGERFQVIALGNGVDDPLRGFALKDLRHRL